MKDGFVKVAAGAPALRVADIPYNAANIADLAKTAAGRGVRLLVTPELSLTGYTCGDLFLQEALLRAAAEHLLWLARETAGLDLLLIVGLPVKKDSRIYNCGALLHRGAVLGLVPKGHLPDYEDMTEPHVFAPAPEGVSSVMLGGAQIPFGQGLRFSCRSLPAFSVGIEVCEDLWVPQQPSLALCRAGATVIANLCASSERGHKAAYRRDLVRIHSGVCKCAYLLANAGEGESTTDAVFSGHEIIAQDGALLCEASPFGSALAVADADIEAILYERRKQNTYPSAESGGTEIWFDMEPRETALEHPVAKQPFMPADMDERADYCRLLLTIQSHALAARIGRVGSKRAVVGVSGGLDSTLTLLALCEAMDRMNRPRTDILALTMPGFGTTGRTRGNAEKMCEALGVELRCVPIGESVERHFQDIGHELGNRNVTFENAQARERTQVLMDVANDEGGMVIGTGDLSELALGWATYNGDHMSMYAINAGMPKTVVRLVVRYYADICCNETLAAVLRDVLDTPVSPELLPPKEGEIEQKTEDLVGPYELHDFFIWYALRWGFSPKKIFRLAKSAFADTYNDATILKWLRNFYRRFFAQQFKRSCMPDGPATTEISLSPRGSWRMPSDARGTVWMQELEDLG
ncbi:MAG: NAD(+) synthase [Clostridiaceae bacterium]|nr:NAD(+) synthase [Clostridiaceae bacterium]